MAKPETQIVVTTRELADRYRVGEETIRRLVRKQKLRPLQAFKPYRFILSDADRAMGVG